MLFVFLILVLNLQVH